MKEKELRMQLQFFADESAEPEAADPESVESQETEGDETPEETESSDESEGEPEQSAEENAIYAKLRRKAEEDALRKYEMKRQQEQANVDAFYAKQCEGKVNPETGKPILTEADYREALAAQERVAMKAQMQQAGVDPSLIDRAIMASPVMQQAQQAILENQNNNASRMMQEDIEAIIALDPTVSKAEDIWAQENIWECVNYVNTHPGARLTDAYKLVNFDRLTSARTEAAKQSAVNAAKSKGHLGSTSGVSGASELADIPESVIGQWEEWFPEKSRKELKELYNKSISA